MTKQSFEEPLSVPLSDETLSAINTHLTPLTPQEILKWALTHLPGLHQTTAFGLTGLVAIDMLSKLTSSPPPLIFLDTLYHFSETYELVEEVKKRYGVAVNIYKPESCVDVNAFEAKFGQKLWEHDESTYDFAVKVFDFCLHSLLHLLEYFYTGRACPACLPRTECSIRNHRSSSLPRCRSCQSKTS